MLLVFSRLIRVGVPLVLVPLVLSLSSFLSPSLLSSATCATPSSATLSSRWKVGKALRSSLAVTQVASAAEWFSQRTRYCRIDRVPYRRVRVWRISTGWYSGLSFLNDTGNGKCWIVGSPVQRLSLEMWKTSYIWVDEGKAMRYATGPILSRISNGPKKHLDSLCVGWL